MKCIIVKNITSCIRTVCGIKLDKNQSCNLGEYSDSKLQLIRALQAAGLQVNLEDFNETPYNYPAYSKETKVVTQKETKVVVEESEKAEEPKETKVKEVKQSAKIETKTKTTEETKQAKSNNEKTKVNKEV